MPQKPIPDAPKSSADIARGAIDAARKQIAEGEAISGRARKEHRLVEQHDDGPLTKAWKQGKSPARTATLERPANSQSSLLVQMIEQVVASERMGRRFTVALGLAVLRERYEALDPNDFPADERTWAEFASKHVPLPLERISELLGSMVHRGARLHCTKCGAGSVCACCCGVPYVGEHRWAMPAPQPAKTESALERAAAAVAARPEKSNRAIAAEIGVAEPTVRRARRQMKDARSDDAVDDAVEARVGRDGRRRKVPGGMGVSRGAHHERE